MIEQLQNFVDTLYWARWILTLVTVVTLGALLADAVADLRRTRRDRDTWADWATDLEAENHELRRRLVIHLATSNDHHHGGRLVALPPRMETQR